MVVLPPQSSTLCLSRLAHACTFLFGGLVVLMGALLPGLHVSYQQAGTLGACPALGVLLSTLLVGSFLDTHGARTPLLTGLATTAAGTLGMACAHHFATLAVAALTYGLGGGILNTASNAMIAHLYPTRRSQALNRLGVLFSLGAISVPLLVATLPGPASRTMLFCLGAFAVLLWIAVWTAQFPTPADAPPTVREAAGFRPLVWHPLVWQIGLLLAVESLAENAGFVWSGKIGADRFHLDARQAGLLLFTLSAAFGLGRWTAGQWIARWGSRRTVMGSAACILVGAGVAGFSTGPLGLWAGTLLLGLGMAAIFPTTLGEAADAFPQAIGAVFATMMTIGLIGSAAGPKIAALLAAGHPLRFFWLPAAAAVAVMVLTLTRKALPDERQRRPVSR